MIDVIPHLVGEFLVSDLPVVPLYFEDLTPHIGPALEIFTANVLWVSLGVVIGMAIGLIPGMGGVIALTILLPFTLTMDPYQAFAFLTGAMGATTMSGSITAILLNTPGSGSNAATIIDGYPMAQKGKGATAIGASAFSSAAGAIIATTLFILSIPILFDVGLLFGPSEIFWLIVSALIIIPLVASGRTMLGLAGAGIGALLALIGRAPATAESRFTFGHITLYDGIPLLPLLIGFFALAEIIRVASSGQTQILHEGASMTGTRLEGIKSVIKHKWLFLRSALIGTLIGGVPGAGGSAAAFIAYGQAVSSAKDKTGFGEGRVEGVIAPESANDAKDGGQLFPTLGLGIPGSSTMAIFIAGLLLHGFTPGPRLVLEETHLVLVISFCLIYSQILTSVLGLTVTNVLLKVLEVSVYKLLPVVCVLAVGATFIARNNAIDFLFVGIFTVLGLLFIYLNISRIPFIIAFILIDILEVNFHYARAYARGDWVSALFTGNINIILIALIVLTVVWYFVGSKRNLLASGPPEQQ